MNNSLAQRVQSAMDSAGLKPAELARAAKTTDATVSNWLKGNIQEDQAKGALAIRIANALAVRVEWLLLGQGASPIDHAPEASHRSLRIRESETERTYAAISLLEGYAGMGRGDYMSDYPEVVENLRVSRDWIARKLPGVPPESIRVITGRGDSMKGRFNDGDLIFIDARVKSFDQDSAYCFRWEGRVQVKRLQFIGSNRVRMLSENASYPPLDVDLDEIEIGGRAMAAWTLTDF